MTFEDYSIRRGVAEMLLGNLGEEIFCWFSDHMQGCPGVNAREPCICDGALWFSGYRWGCRVTASCDGDVYAIH